MNWSLWGVSHLGLAKLVYCNQILDYVADQNYITFIYSLKFKAPHTRFPIIVPIANFADKDLCMEGQNKFSKKIVLDHKRSQV